jgi:hypothetical protein
VRRVFQNSLFVTIESGKLRVLAIISKFAARIVQK